MQKESVLIIVGILVASVILLYGADWLEITGKAGGAEEQQNPQAGKGELMNEIAEINNWAAKEMLNNPQNAKTIQKEREKKNKKSRTGF